MKKIISVVLSVLMVFAVMAPAVSAADGKVVTVYVEGYGYGLNGKSGEQAFPVDLGLIDGLKEILDELLVNLAVAEITGDYSEYSNDLYELIAPGYADLKLDNNGEPTDDNGNVYNALEFNPATHLEYYGDRYDGGYYLFHYDWRLSVEYNAEVLDQYINNVIASTGATKVNLVGRCLGGNIISAYLQNAPETSINRLNKVVMYIPSTLGVDFISALFSGNIVLDPEAIDNYAKYSLAENDLLGGVDGDLFDALTTIVSFVNEAYILGFGTDVIERIVQAVKDDALARILRDSYGSFPSFWAMVCPEDVEEAIALVYNTDELQEEYAGMIEKIRSYHQNVQLNAADRMVELKEQGIEIMVVSKYNFANFPLSDNAAQQSDGTASTTATSFGAVTANFGSTLTNKYIKSMDEADKKYLSPDEMIDASTCILPDNTWFIKNLYHDCFPYSVDVLFNTFFNTEGMTIDSYEEYPQFLKYDDETGSISPVTGLDDGDIIDKDSKQSKALVFIRFFRLLIEILTKIFNGEFDLSGLTGSKTE